MTERPHVPTSSSGQCRECKRRREVFSCSHRGGGNYRMAPRWRQSSICAECAEGALSRATPDQPGSWGISTVEDIVATIDTDEAREILAEWRVKVEAKRKSSAEADERMRPYWTRVRELNAIKDYLSSLKTPHAEMTPDNEVAEVTIRSISGDVHRGLAGTSNAGMSYDADGAVSYEKTIRDMVADWIEARPESDSYLDVDTCASLAAAIRNGDHMVFARPERNI